MKYKLLKDLPDLKAGAIFEWNEKKQLYQSFTEDNEVIYEFKEQHITKDWFEPVNEKREKVADVISKHPHIATKELVDKIMVIFEPEEPAKEDVAFINQHCPDCECAIMLSFKNVEMCPSCFYPHNKKQPTFCMKSLAEIFGLQEKQEVTKIGDKYYYKDKATNQCQGCAFDHPKSSGYDCQNPNKYKTSPSVITSCDCKSTIWKQAHLIDGVFYKTVKKSGCTGCHFFDANNICTNPLNIECVLEKESIIYHKI